MNPLQNDTFNWLPAASVAALVLIGVSTGALDPEEFARRFQSWFDAEQERRTVQVYGIATALSVAALTLAAIAFALWTRTPWSSAAPEDEPMSKRSAAISGALLIGVWIWVIHCVAISIKIVVFTRPDMAPLFLVLLAIAGTVLGQSAPLMGKIVSALWRRRAGLS